MEVLAPPPTDPLVRQEPPFDWYRTPDETRPRVETASSLPDLDPDVALWPVTPVNRWPFTGAPTEGIYPRGWIGVDNTGTAYICTVAGEPGTWVAVGSGGGGGWPTVDGAGSGHLQAQTLVGDTVGYNMTDEGTGGITLVTNNAAGNGIGLSDTGGGIELSSNDGIILLGLAPGGITIETGNGGATTGIGITTQASDTGGIALTDHGSGGVKIQGVTRFAGSGSPVGVVTPKAKGDLYVDDTTPGLWQATGATSADWAQVGTSVQTPVLFGIGNHPSGAAMASFVNEGLASMTPLPSLFDGAPLQYWSALQEQGGVILAGTGNALAATFIGHDLNLIYRSTDGGNTWTGIATPWDSLIGGGGVILAIAFGTGADVMAVGASSALGGGELGVLWSTDNGVTWTDITADTPFAGGGATDTVSCAFDGTVWYLATDTPIGGVGLWTAVTPTTLGSWTARTTGLDAEVVVFVVATPAVAFAGGGSGTVCLVVSTDHGVTWTDQANPFDGHQQPDLMVTDGSGNWLAWNAHGTGIAAMAQSLDNGATWGTPVDLPAFATRVAACFLAGTGWVTIWGNAANPTSAAAQNAVIVYSAPVANPLVITPTGYAADNIYAPSALIPV